MLVTVNKNQVILKISTRDT